MEPVFASSIRGVSAIALRTHREAICEDRRDNELNVFLHVCIDVYNETQLAEAGQPANNATAYNETLSQHSDIV